MKPPGFRLFRPILAGARLGDRTLAAAGAMVAIALAGLVSSLVAGGGVGLLLVAPMGASAVLLFAVPASPLAQPWPIVGGNVLSALIGIAVAHVVPMPVVASGTAVAAAILGMSLLRCLHPPGGAAALLAVLGGPAVTHAGYAFALVPVGLNALLLAALGWVFHRFSGHSWPHRPSAAANIHHTRDTPAPLRTGFTDADVDRALDLMGDAFDIGPEDIRTLLRKVEEVALARSHGDLLCADVMSRDVIRADPSLPRETAVQLLLRHNIRTLPVVRADGRVIGVVRLRDLIRPGANVGEVMSPAATAGAGDPVLSLLAPLTAGPHHAVVILDGSGALAGIVTQTDLLAAAGRLLAVHGRATAR